MFLSIIIPIYNKEKYISECIDSCIHQDLDSSDYEIICVNDGSTDNSGSIISNYQANNTNIIVINKENGGLSNARNAGLAAASGDYVWFVDADDYIDTPCLQLLKRKSLSERNDYIKFGVYHFQDKLSNEELEMKRQRRLVAEFDESDAYATLAIYRRAFLLENQIRFDDSIRAYGEDTFFGYYLIQKLPVKLDFGESYPLYFYRHNSVSITGNRKDEAIIQRIDTYFRLAGIIKKDYDHGRLNDPNVRKDAANRMMQFYRFAMRDLAKLPLRKIRPILKQQKKEKLFPLKQPAECTYNSKQFVREKNGQSAIMNFLRYHSNTRLGFFCFSFLFQLKHAKIWLSRSLRKNRAANALLNLKNRILRRKR